MDSTSPAALEAVHQESAIKQEFAPSSAPWNQFAPGQLVIDSSSEDDTDNPPDDQPEVSATLPFESAPGASLNTLNAASSMDEPAPHIAMKQDLDDFSKAVKSGLKFVRTVAMDGRSDSGAGVPGNLHQLPSLDITQASRIWNGSSATPMLLPEVKYHIKYWRVAFFSGIFVYVDESAAMCLQTLAPEISYQLIKPHMLDLSSLIARRDKDAVKLISSKDAGFEEMKGDFRPSFNTLGRRAFTFYLRPHLNTIERRELQAFWTSLPPFDPLKPNHDPTRPCQPATPRKIGLGLPILWDWSDMLQPARWFICPCALAGHPCAFTGEPPVNCRGWHDVCTEQFCTHGPETRFIHTGSGCSPAFDGKPCGLGRNCRFQHGVAMVAKSIEHRLYHHRKLNCK